MTGLISDESFWFLTIAALLLALLFGRRILWRLFSFDKDVAKVLSERKSSEVRVGKIVESIAPLIEGFPVDFKKPGTSTIFLGQPVDYVHFDPEDGITFIEVKSGNSQLSQFQKKIRKSVEDSKIRWVEFKVR